MPRSMTVPFHIPISVYRRQLTTLVRQALDEDIGTGDLTVKALDLGRQSGEAVLVAKSGGILAGADAFEATFRQLDRRMRFDWTVEEGARFRAGNKVVRIQGRASALLTGERTAINFVAHLSGIATATRHLVDLIPKGRTRLLDTRKTTPGWRYLEKRATVIGGAVNHRLGLHDALMVKDTHIGAVGDFEEAIQRALKAAGIRPLVISAGVIPPMEGSINNRSPVGAGSPRPRPRGAHAASGRGNPAHTAYKRPVICEIHHPSQMGIAIALGAQWLLLDNFNPKVLRHLIAAVRQLEKSTKIRVVIEASGGVTSETIAAIARCGPDYISAGSITHSAPAIDFSMKWVSR